MDGQANDFMIDENGELVPVDPEEWEPIIPVQAQVCALVMITQYGTGTAVMHVYGEPTPEMVTALHTAMRGMMFVLTPQ